MAGVVSNVRLQAHLLSGYYLVFLSAATPISRDVECLRYRIYRHTDILTYLDGYAYKNAGMINGTMNRTTNLFVLLIVISFILPATAIRYAQAQLKIHRRVTSLEVDRTVVVAVVEMNSNRVTVLKEVDRTVVVVLEMNSRAVVTALEMDSRVVVAVAEMDNRE